MGVTSRPAGEGWNEEKRHGRLEERPDAVLHLADDCCVWASASSSEVLGWQARELIGRTQAQMLHPDDFARVAATTRTAMQSDLSVTPRLRYRFRHRSGHWQWVSAVAHRIDYFDGSPTWAVVIKPASNETPEALRSAEPARQAS